MIATTVFIVVALLFQIAGSALSTRGGWMRVTGWRSDRGFLVGLVALAAAFAAGWMFV